MSHVDENNYLIVQYDMLIQEYMKSNRTKDVFVDIFSPYFFNFQIPSKWPSFTSNFFTISDIDNFQDLIKFIRGNEATIRILTLSKQEDKKKNMGKYYIQKKDLFLKKLYEMGCEVYFTHLNHGKITLTSQGVLFGSANYTGTGLDPEQQWNIGHYFPKLDSAYNRKREYVYGKFTDESVISFNGD